MVKQHIVFLTGASVSAESGLQHSVEKLILSKLEKKFDAIRHNQHRYS